MNNKLRPAIIGGVVLGLLSAIPFVNFLNICCCAWAILGGALAVYMYVNASPVPVRSGDGALLGAMAGLIGSVIYWIVGIPLSLLAGNAFNNLIVTLMERVDPNQAETLRRSIELANSQPLIERLPGILLGAIIGLALLTIFSTIGGLIGTAMFEKRKGVADIPPPPPNYS